MKYIRLSEWCRLNGLKYRAGNRQYHAGLIEGAKQLPTGTIIVPVYEDDQVDRPEYNVVYSWVSSSEQSKTNLETQAKRVSDFVNANGKVVHKIVKEVGSGLNDRRPKLLSILGDDNVTAIYVEHKDRLTRFGFEYIKLVCDMRGISLIIINEAADDEHDLMQDFVSLVTSFCSRLYGQRRTKRKTEKIIEILKEDLS